MSNELAIIQKENVELIISSAPKAYTENLNSHDRCIEFGQTILSTIEQRGMSDDIDRQAAEFIERAKKTVRKMNEKRSPITKLFDEIRNKFTAMEGEIDPSKKDSVPFVLQQYRNQFATKKQQEAEAKRREEMQRQQTEFARNKYREDCEEDYRRSFGFTLDEAINRLTEINSMTTLNNFDSQADAIRQFSVTLAPDWKDKTIPCVVPPRALTIQEASELRNDILTQLFPKFSEQYKFELESLRDTLIAMLPSKKMELQRIAKASEEDAALMKAQIAAREAQEAARIEQERKQKEAEQAQLQELKKQNTEISGLFGSAQAAVADYQPKVQVRKKLVPMNVEAFMPILSLWWTQEGCTLTVDELSKLFKKQVTFCEKLANDKSNPIQIESEHICYENDVKAK